MKLNQSIGYALRAVAYIAKNTDKKKIISQTISKECDIPLDYLYKILLKLAQANILRSKRGPRGGYSLTKAATKINLLEIIEAIDGPMVRQLDIAEQAPREKFAKKTDKVCDKAIAQARSVFQKTKFSELL